MELYNKKSIKYKPILHVLVCTYYFFDYQKKGSIKQLWYLMSYEIYGIYDKIHRSLVE